MTTRAIQRFHDRGWMPLIARSPALAATSHFKDGYARALFLDGQQRASAMTNQHEAGSQSPQRAYGLDRVSIGTSAINTPATFLNSAQRAGGSSPVPSAWLISQTGTSSLARFLAVGARTRPLPSITAEMPML